MRTALLLLLALAAPALASQTVWKWVDDKGVTHYSDRPVPGATKIELNVGSRAAPSDASSASSRPTAQEPVTPAGPAYPTFEIRRPQNDEAVINTGGVVVVDIGVEPRVLGGHILNLYLDGNRVTGYPLNTTTYELKEVPRGTHTVNAVITDTRGSPIQETAKVNFTVRQESIAKPPVGPSLRPPPKPRPRAQNKLPTTQPTYAQLNGARPVVDPRTNAPVVRKPKPKPAPPK